MQQDAGQSRRLSIAVIAAAIAFGASYAVFPHWQSAPWGLCFAGVMASAWFGGQRQSIVTTVILVVLGRYCFMKPYGSLTIDQDNAASIVLFSSVSLFIGLFASARGRAQAFELAERRRFQATVMSIGDAVIATDARGIITFMNGVAESLTGWTLGDAKGRQLEEVFVVVDHETRATVIGPIKKALETSRIQCLGQNTILIGRDGTERSIEDSISPIKDCRSVISGVVLVFRDVTEKRRIDDELRSARARLEAALSAGSIATWGWDFVNQRMIADASLERLFSVAPRSDLGDAVSSYVESIHPEDVNRVSRVIGQAIAGGRSYDLEYRIVQKDGSIRSVVARGKIERDELDRATSLSGVIVDITEQKNAEKERSSLLARLAAQARIFESALSNSPDFIYTFDLEARFTYINQALLSIMKLDAAEVIGKRFGEFKFPQDLAALLDGQIREVIETRNCVSGEVPFTNELGTRHFEHIFVPVFGPDHEVEAVAGSTRNVTERRKSEEITRRRAEQLQKLAQVATRINSAHDVQSVVDTVNEEARSLVGPCRSTTNVVISSPFASLTLIAASASEQQNDLTRHGGDPAAYLEVIQHENRPLRLSRDQIEGDSCWQHLQSLGLAIRTTTGWLAAPLVDRNGKCMGLLQLADKNEGEFTEEDEAILVQLSRLASIAIENAKLYNELKQTDRRKDEFLAMLAHELRNPLAAIGNAVGVTTRSGYKENIEWSMDIIIRQIKHLTRLIDDLLDVSRISRGKIELRRDILDATSILESAAATVQPLVDERKHKLNLTLEWGNLWVNADPTRLEQIVVNLLNNAAKYSENAAEIRLSAYNEGQQVVIAVHDQGVGIAPEKLDGMFELFVQGDRSLARSEGGLGIGLTVVKRLVEMHGGTITATSEGPGKGSDFTIRMPAAARPVVPRPKILSAAPKEVGGKTRILVVDDNVDTVRGMVRLLRMIGHEVVSAHDGPVALELARKFRPEFILLDIGLPGMDGYEIAAILRQDAICRDAVIVAVSGYGQEEDRRRSREAGFDHHFIKPLDHDALLGLLSNRAHASV